MDQFELALGALRSLKLGEKPNISLIARIYSVDYLNLLRCFYRVMGSKEV